MFKLAVEFAASAIVVGAGIAMTHVTFFGTTYVLGWMGPPLTVLWILVHHQRIQPCRWPRRAGRRPGRDCRGHVRRRARCTRGGSGRAHARRPCRSGRRLSGLQPSPGQDLPRRLREPAGRVSLVGHGHYRAAKGRHDAGGGRPAADLCLPLAEAVVTVFAGSSRASAIRRLGCRATCEPSGGSSRPTAVTSTIDCSRAGLPLGATVLLLYLLACLFSVTALVSMEVP